MTEQFVEVALSLPLRKEFTYRLPGGMSASVGSRVRVPFRGRELPGVVTRLTFECELAPGKLRDVQKVVESQLQLPEPLLRLARRMADEYGCSLGEALDAMLPSAAKQRGARKIPCVTLNIPNETAQIAVAELEDKRQAQSRVLRAVVEFGGPMPIRQLTRRTNTSDSPWQTLVKNGLLRRDSIVEEGEEIVADALEAAARHELNAEQRVAVDTVLQSVAEQAHKVFLLHGVTGSGKTEVYLHVLEAVRKSGRTGIVLVPEISLTPQTVGRFASRFPDVAVLHSGLTDAQRGRQWRRLMSGKAGVAIGARSALFAPVRNLGLIILDEEHESTFKQENTPRYHARNMAIARGEIESATVILGSATPSLESYGRARRGAYELLTLKKRAGKGTLPHILVEDLRKEGRECYVEGVPLSRTLQNLMKERVDTRDQMILFLNRRGFAPVLICPQCGSVVKCRRCDVSMTGHVRRHRLICHYCCEEQRWPETCPTCGHDKLHELGSGTERVEKAIKKLFPTAVVARMDADTMVERGAHERVLKAFRKRQIDVLIGTQMIAKGLDFPDVTLVGVISADTGLFLPDYRAAERTFQLLHQVTGRAGRGEKPGTVVYQTLCPDNYAVKAASNDDYEAFVQEELQFRRAAGYPPFSRLIRVLVESRREDLAFETVKSLLSGLRSIPQTEILGPAPAVISRVKERFRVHGLVKCFNEEGFATAMARLDEVERKSTSSMRVTLDVDPGALL